MEKIRSRLNRRERTPVAEQGFIENQYNLLLQEREQLLAELDGYEFRDYVVVLDESTPEQISDIAEQWEANVRENSGLFDSFDQLGIKVIGDNLAQQPGFPETTIQFQSQQLINTYHRHSSRATEGLAYVSNTHVGLAGAHPNLNAQLRSILRDGKLDQTVAVLVHELIHIHNQNNLAENEYTDSAMTEAQAYLSALMTGNSASIVSIVEQLQGNGYEIQTDVAIAAVNSVMELYALGFEETEISKIVAHSKYDSSRHIYLPVQSIIDDEVKKRGLDEIQKGALNDLYRLRLANDTMKMQLVLYSVIDEVSSADQRESMRMEGIEFICGVPSYKLNGKQVDAEGLQQNVMVACNENYPYSMNGLRTGVIWGYFPDSSGEYIYGIGRWEADGEDGSINLAHSREEEDRYIADISENAKQVTEERKQDLIVDALFRAESDSLELRLIKAFLIEEEGIYTIVDAIQSEFSMQHIKGMLSSLRAARRRLSKWEREIQEDPFYDPLFEEEVDITMNHVSSLFTFIEEFSVPMEELWSETARILREAKDYMDQLHAFEEKRLAAIQDSK